MKNNLFYLLALIILSSCELGKLEFNNCPSSQGINLTVINQTQESFVIQAVEETCNPLTSRTGHTPTSITKALPPILAGETIEERVSGVGSVRLNLRKGGIIYDSYSPDLSKQQLTLYIILDGANYKLQP